MGPLNCSFEIHGKLGIAWVEAEAEELLDLLFARNRDKVPQIVKQR